MDVDAFGITDSWEIRYHLQSYFLIFFPNAIRSRAFQRFWSRFPTISDKPWLIRNGEVRLTSVLARSKLRLGALCPYCMVVWAVTIPLLVVSASIALQARRSNSAVVRVIYNWRWSLVTLWYTGVVLLILERFWNYWSTLI